MIYYEVPKINPAVERESIEHNRIKNRELVDQMVKEKINQYKPSVKASKNWEGRKESLKKLVELYYYFKDTKSNDERYSAYLTTMDKILNKGGLINTADSSYPYNQFKSMAVEPLTMEALNKSTFGFDAIFPEHVGGRQDFGVDAVIEANGVKHKIDVKTAAHYDPLNKESPIGKIKYYAVDDNSKETNYIVWTGNNFYKGYITIKGSQRWNEVAKEIGEDIKVIEKAYRNGETINTKWRVDDSFGDKYTRYNRKTEKVDPLYFYTQEMQNFDKRRIFDNEYIGNFPSYVKNEIEQSSSWLKPEYEYRAKIREEIERLEANTLKILESKDPQHLTNEEVLEVDKLLVEMIEKTKGYIGVKKVKKLGRELSAFAKEIKTPTTTFLKEVGEKVNELSKVEIKDLSEAEKEYIRENGLKILNLGKDGYTTRQAKDIYKKIKELQKSIKREALQDVKSVSLSNLSKKENSKLRTGLER